MRAGVGDTRVSGASALLAEGASQKPFYGIRTRGSQGPDDSQGRGADMEQEHGAFKVNRPTPLPADSSRPGDTARGRSLGCSIFIQVQCFGYYLCK